ncbi:hypothetical protein [Methylobacterium sp. Gmos1]
MLRGLDPLPVGRRQGPERAVLPAGLARQEDHAGGVRHQDLLAGSAPLTFQRLQVDLDHDEAGGRPARRDHGLADEQARLLGGGADPEVARGTGREGVVEVGPVGVGRADEAERLVPVAGAARQALLVHQVDRRDAGGLRDRLELGVDGAGCGGCGEEIPHLRVEGEHRRQVLVPVDRGAQHRLGNHQALARRAPRLVVASLQGQQEGGEHERQRRRCQRPPPGAGPAEPCPQAPQRGEVGARG